MRRWLGDSTATRARRPATIFGAMSASTPDGSLTALIQSSLRRSLLHVFRLTLPGSDLIAAQTSGPGTSPGSLPSAAPCQPSGPSPGGTPGSSPAAAIIDHIRAVTSSCRRLLTFAVSVSSDCLSADPIIRPSRILLGCSICSSRSLASSASRTRWAWRSRLQTSPASHLVSFSASATEHSRKPQERAHRLAGPLSRPAFPVEQPKIGGRHLHLRGDPADSLIGQLRAPCREAALHDEELQPQRQPQPRRPGPASQQVKLIADQCPVLDQLVFVQHTRHDVGPSGGQAMLHPTNPPQY